MSSRSSLSTDSSALPDKKLVEEVAKACGCREETAITLLQVSTGTILA
jgi:methenyltetrahydromethanopterin cyclohydrolase